MQRYGKLLGALLAGVAGAGSGVTGAQDYPTRVIRIVVGDAAGSGADIQMRLIAQKLTESWGQQVIVDNRPGANGIIGAELAARSKPDGYTLLAGVPSMLAMNQFVYRKIPYNTLRDFTPVTQVATNHFALVVTPSLPARSVADLVRLVRGRPGDLIFASAGVGNQNHLAVEMFAKAADLKLLHVPHKGTAPALTDLMSGQVMLMFNAALAVSTHIDSGRIRLLATGGPQRVPAYPDAPTLVESGHPDVVVLGWTGMLAPSGTPAEIVARLSREVGRHLAADDAKKIIAKGSDLTPSTPEAFAVFIKSEIDRWSKVIRAVGLEHSQ
jgi:tripartite-type tricarboxylate transporter receptor subunit TctC